MAGTKKGAAKRIIKRGSNAKTKRTTTSTAKRVAGKQPAKKRVTRKVGKKNLKKV